MAWDFVTDPQYQEKLDWVERLLTEEILPLEALQGHWESPRGAGRFRELTGDLKARVKAEGLWAAHLPPELGGQGFGQVKLALLHELLGQSLLAPPIFGNAAPDSGNAELLAVGGTQEQKERWMAPLLEGTLRSSFSMTEPGAGSDPMRISTIARRDGDEWAIDGHKWFSGMASGSDFLIVMAKTDPDAPVHRNSFSMIVVPTGTPGVRILRDIPSMHQPCSEHRGAESHAEIMFEDARVPFNHVVGGADGVGQGFALAQKRLGPGRIHHAMRWLGQSKRAFDMLVERAVSREVHGSRLADKQLVQEWISESYAEREAARLLTLQAAWKMDQLHAEGRHYSEARVEIGVIKFWGARVLYNVIDRALQAHGSLGYSTDLPLESMYRTARAARIYDGPDEVHKVNVAKQLIRGIEARAVPSEHIPTRRAAAAERFGVDLDVISLNR